MNNYKVKYQSLLAYIRAVMWYYLIKIIHKFVVYYLTNIACKFKYINYERNQDLSFLIIFTIIIIIYYCLSKNNYIPGITEYKSLNQPKSYHQVQYTTAYTEILE